MARREAPGRGGGADGGAEALLEGLGIERAVEDLIGSEAGEVDGVGHGGGGVVDDDGEGRIDAMGLLEEPGGGAIGEGQGGEEEVGALGFEPAEAFGGASGEIHPAVGKLFN